MRSDSNRSVRQSQTATQPGDTAERYFYRIPDDFSGWRQFVIPFELFQRRTDFQPGGAPNDGLGLDAVSGYAVGLPAGTGTVLLDDMDCDRQRQRDTPAG